MLLTAHKPLFLGGRSLTEARPCLDGCKLHSSCAHTPTPPPPQVSSKLTRKLYGCELHVLREGKRLSRVITRCNKTQRPGGRLGSALFDLTGRRETCDGFIGWISCPHVWVYSQGSPSKSIIHLVHKVPRGLPATFTSRLVVQIQPRHLSVRTSVQRLGVCLEILGPEEVFSSSGAQILDADGLRRCQTPSLSVVLASSCTAWTVRTEGIKSLRQPSCGP